ncbi:hypothetical protein NLJ89_g332 [Agrocybe chaxingu]|uniref:Uncharacterized protein n=1 Tax=Agrocybe chaxingu TaxID=84603 RepID=A0A9W8N279_9AGAR|nr:hypothetical protein NLJ89_g332 [Agrocybe chaxingu]
MEAEISSGSNESASKAKLRHETREWLAYSDVFGLILDQAIISTCRQWRKWGSEFLFRCLYFSKPAKFISLCAILDASSATTTTVTSSQGWWSRRLHISRDYHRFTGQTTMEDVEQSLVSIIRHCPNLEVFVVERPLGAAFGPIVDALSRHSHRHLHTVRWNIPGESLAKVIWALNSLPCLMAAQIDIETPVPFAQEIACLGSANEMRLKLPRLQQLSLYGYAEEFLEQAVGWEIPALQSFSIDSGTSSHDNPDIIEFLKQHGANLTLLDLHLGPTIDLPVVLDLCPNLSTFTFNSDWPFPAQDDGSSELVNHPHWNVTMIGLHGLSYAFGVGYNAVRASSQPMSARLFTRANELNFAALNRRNFPKLQRIRVLSRTVLNDLNDENGPQGEGYQRWSKWWKACVRAGIGLEDCTGQSLGVLPQDESVDIENDEEEDIDDEGEEEEEEDSDGTWGTDESDEEEEESSEEEWESEPPLPEPNARVMELSRLLEEVRAMNATRDEALIRRIRIPRPPSPVDQ